MIKVSYDITEIEEIAKLVVTKCSHKIFLIDGEMGAGKTTLIKSICAYLGVTDTVSSPSFSLVNEYEADHCIIYHFDFYRITDQEEALAIGFEEYEYTGDYLFIEWSERISDLIPEQANRIHIKIEPNKLRTITF